MTKKILLGVGVLIAAILVFAALKPAHYRVSREIVIYASPEAIFPFINDAKKMDEWNPWVDVDPTVKMEYSGPAEGVGATSSWKDAKQMGTGSATVVESVPGKLVKTKLVYTKPFKMEQMAQFDLEMSPEGTLVRWSVEGESNFIGRIFCLFQDMDKMIGGTFDKGLAKLRQTVEAPPPPALGS